MLDPMLGNGGQNPTQGNASPTELQRAQEEYASQAATKARREMAMALQNRSATKELPKHWAQVFGNVANDALGAYEFNKANEVGRNSVKKDSGTFIDQMFGAGGPAVPFAPPAPGVNYNPNVGRGNPMPPTGPGMAPGMGGVSPGLPTQAGWQDPTMRPPQGMPPQQGVPFTPGSEMPPGSPELPNEGGMFGGLGWRPMDWPQSLFNPQG